MKFKSTLYIERKLIKEKEKKNRCTSMGTLQTYDRQLSIEFIITKQSFFKRTIRRGVIITGCQGSKSRYENWHAIASMHRATTIYF